MLTHIQELGRQGLMWVGHLFRFLLMTPSVCCVFLATELHCVVQFNVYDTACLWILVKVLICFRQCGSHDADAYSSIGRTRVV